MICLERDGEELLGFGGCGRRDMDELEEGEACSYHTNNNNNDFDAASVDPDIALSYIEEKVQHVLGHFQKDFEGGVSAENLGAKFGGYGSFLPTTCSPVWPQPRTPPKTQQNNVPKSPNNLQMEGVRRSSIFSSNASQSLRQGSASVNVAKVPTSKASVSLIDSAKKEVCMPSTDFAEEFPPKLESVKKRNANLPDPKLLKVRIKMGSDNLSMQNNDAIYSGLGLDVSPSSSLDDSPSESEEMSREPQGTPFESPAHILQIMTCFPVHGGELLSPLPDDLLHLIELEKLPKDSGSLPVPRGGPQGSCILLNGSDSVKNDRKFSVGKFTKLPERNETSTNSKSEKIKDSVNFEGSTCEELVSNASKLPIVSNSHPANADMGKGMGGDFIISKEVNKGAMNNTALPDLKKEEQVGRTLKQEDWLIDNPKSSINGKFGEDKKSSSVDSTSLHSRKDGRHKGEKHDDYVKIDSSSSMGKRGLNSELTNLSKEKANQKTASYEQEGMKLPSGKGSSSSDGKKKTKGSQGKAKASSENIPKESSRAGSSSTSKSKKSTYEDNYTTEGEMGDIKSQKQTGKSRDRYKDFFGDIELEQGNRMSPSEMSSEEERLKNHNVVEKIAHATSSVVREKSSGKKPDKMLMSEPQPTAALSVPPTAVNGSILDAAPAAVAPVVFQENWVCCDKCQTWRLLPLGKNPQDLPEKWLCSMLNWLPGMNKCSFTEEETTNALRALYQVPTPVGQSNLHRNIDGSGIASTAFADTRQPDQNQHGVGLHAMPAGGKKKQGLKEFSNIHYKDGTTQFLNSTKKMTETSVSINDAKRSTIGDEPDYMKLSKSSDMVVEKSKHRKKEKLKGFDNRSDEGDNKRSKVKTKRDHDQEFSRSSKKIRSDALMENWMPDHSYPPEKAGPSLTNGQLTMSSCKNLPNYNDHTSLKDSKHDQKDWVQVSAKKSKDKAQVSLHGSMDVGKQNNGNVSKKRKSKEIHNGQPHQGSILNSESHGLDRILEKEDFDDNEYRKEKKARISRFDGKESSSSKGSGRTDKKGGRKRSQSLGQDLGSTMSQRSLEGMDPLKRDSGKLHPSAAATSSSSKVSGSRKSKASFHEAKGSPVESVSSSPMRVSKPEKLPSARRDLSEKDDSPETGLLPLGEDDGGSGRSRTARKDKTLDAANHGSLESTVLDFQEKDSDDKAKMQIVSSPNLTNPPFTIGNADYVGTNTRYSGKSTTFDRCRADERQNSHHHVNASSSKKSGKGSSSRPKDKLKNFHSESDSGIVKISDSINEQASADQLKSADGKNKNDDKIGVKFGEDENVNVAKKDLERPLLNDNGNRESNSNAGDAKAAAICVQDPTTIAKQNLLPHGAMAPKREKSHSTVPSRGAQNDTVGHCPQPASELLKENGIISASHGDNALKVLKKNREVEHQNGIHQNAMRTPSSSSHRVKDLDSQSPVKKDSVSQAANNAIKEAKNLKHMADRLKNSGSTESSRLYLEAILKFLNAASLLESNGNENGRTGEMIQSLQMYSSTAKLCEFCAHECEKSKDMATAALAYKCMEVAYMRVIYSSHASANRDRSELQNAIQVNPPGESPSSSASDVDNLNHPTTADKVPLAKGISSPQVAGNHTIVARYRPNFVRLLNFTQDANFAMEASRKSRIAFAAANLSLGEDHHKETIKRALDFNFQDVEGLLRLVRLAIEAISSQK